MTTWYVHRRADHSIASAHQELQVGYAEEALADDAAELVAFFGPVLTIADRAESTLLNDPLWRATIRVMANRFGITVPQLVATIKAQVN